MFQLNWVKLCQMNREMFAQSKWREKNSRNNFTIAFNATSRRTKLLIFYFFWGRKSVCFVNFLNWNLLKIPSWSLREDRITKRDKSNMMFGNKRNWKSGSLNYINDLIKRSLFSDAAFSCPKWLPRESREKMWPEGNLYQFLETSNVQRIPLF